MEIVYITIPEMELLVKVLQIVIGLIVIPRIVRLITDFIPFIGGGSP